MRTDFDTVIIGANADGLLLAASLADSGEQVALLEPGMKCGGELLTESFLTPHRYDLAGGWFLTDPITDRGIPADMVDGLRLLRPEIPFAFLFAGNEPLILYRSGERTCQQLGRADGRRLMRLFRTGREIHALVDGHFSDREAVPPDPGRLPAAFANRTTRQLLDEFGFQDVRLRCALTCLPLALGHDIASPGSAAALAYVLHGLTNLDVVHGGSGSIAAHFTDRIAKRGGVILESARIAAIERRDRRVRDVVLADGRRCASPRLVVARSDIPLEGITAAPPAAGDSRTFGAYRIYLAYSRPPGSAIVDRGSAEDVNRAFMIGTGFDREEDIYRYLETSGRTHPPFVAGQLISTRFRHATDGAGQPGRWSGDLWCTACHTRDPRELKRMAGSGSRADDSRMRTAVIGDEADPSTEPNGTLIRPEPTALIWQGVLPMQTRSIDPDGFRKSFARACIDHISHRLTGVDVDDVRFQLAWLPQETREPLLGIDMLDFARRGRTLSYETRMENVFVNPYARLARHTGLRTGLKLLGSVGGASG